jgi:hypothetical protein
LFLRIVSILSAKLDKSQRFVRGDSQRPEQTIAHSVDILVEFHGQHTKVINQSVLTNILFFFFIPIQCSSAFVHSKFERIAE